MWAYMAFKSFSCLGEVDRVVRQEIFPRGRGNTHSEIHPWKFSKFITEIFISEIKPKITCKGKTYLGFELWFPLTIKNISSVHVKMTALHFWCYYIQSQSFFLKQGTVMQQTKTISVHIFLKGLAIGWETKRMNIMNIPSITTSWNNKELSFQRLQTGWKSSSLSSTLPLQQTYSCHLLSHKSESEWKLPNISPVFRVFWNCSI